jgi:P27 family predicted phage terminase small subunit
VLPRCPEHLDGGARECWRRLSRELYDAGLLTTIDRDALAAYCTAYARWRKAEDMLGKSGEVILTNTTSSTDADGNVTKGGGNLVQNPWLAVSNRAQEQMSKLGVEFGMTPSSRSRVKAEISAAKHSQAQPERMRPVAQPTGTDPRAVLGDDS